MTIEREPHEAPAAPPSFAALMSALGGSSCMDRTNVERVHHARDVWWAQKKRKRAVSCGACEACTRDDCGKCMNCLDKPKYGGHGVRKQSCLLRKCRNSNAVGSGAAGPSGDTRSAAGASPVKQKEGMPANDLDVLTQMKQPKGMSANETRDFWGAVQCCMQLAANESAAKMRPVTPVEDHRLCVGKRPKLASARLARCGACAGCTRGDCGVCKNCRDKAKYGGRGIKKQACLKRLCLVVSEHPREGNKDDEAHAADRAAFAAAAALAGASEGGFLSQGASPALAPSVLGVPADDGLLEPHAARLFPPRMPLLLKAQLEAGTSYSTAYSTADEEEANEGAAKDARAKGGSSLLASPARACHEREQEGASFSMILGAAAALPTLPVV